MKRPVHDIPFRPAKCPVFYGWVVLAAGALGVLASVPGQTIGVSAFTDPLLDALELNRVELSTAYFLGTMGSALLIARAGKIYDRYGARPVGFATAVAMGLVLWALTLVDQAAAAVGALFGGRGRVLISMTLLTLGFFGLRFLGQGVLTLVSRSMVMKWFERRRGLANGLIGVCVALGFPASPPVFNAWIQRLGWRGAWGLLGALIGIGLSLLILLFYRDTPERCGLEPDGGLTGPKRSDLPDTHPDRDWTLPEARRTYAFWVFNLTMVMFAFYMTALSFHIVNIFELSGMDRGRAMMIFLPGAAIGLTLELVVNWLSDYTKLKYILWAELVGLGLSTAALAILEPGWPVIMLIVGNGIMGGVFGVLIGVTWPRLFGRTHLGAIAGLNMGCVVAGSALGPVLFSLSQRWSGNYTIAALVCLSVCVTLFAASLRVKPPKREPSEES
ncbi:MFS transporter [Kiritimatiella glycovorans]|uniref:Phosphoglycerate transporter family protein n=1 Tax=Kiritimatiella glycovorans TaxID=1307763 RepID=A0A0G3EF39_9BACT|nr:MFS transporter [Kiritimatiella glycovorans]AKJ64047.1 phosphoglycerate transporter family protein [Kiritimatiella glycovorans]